MKTRKLLLVPLLMCLLSSCGGTQESVSSEETSSSNFESESSQVISSNEEESSEDKSSEIESSEEISSIIESSIIESSEESSTIESSEESSTIESREQESSEEEKSSEVTSSEEKEVVDTDYDGLPDEIDNDPEVNIKTANVFTDDSYGFVLNGNISFKVDYRKFVQDSNEEYNNDLAQLALVLSNDLMALTSTKITNAIYPQQSSIDRKSLYDEFGCEDFEYHVQGSELVIDQEENDLNNYALAHHSFKFDQEKHDVVFLVLEGTDSSDNRQWFSNFDAGCDSDSYYELTGKHDLWKDTDDHKGFAIATRRIMESVNEYIDKNVDKQNCILFITGYSRGGAIANLIGKYYETESTYKSFTYAFAAPTTTTSSEEDCKKIKTVFNIINDDDVVPHIPFSCWGFRRYGTDLITSANTYKEAFDQQFGGSYVCVPNTIYDGVGDVFGTTRESIYALGNETLLDTNKTEEDAKKYLDTTFKPKLVKYGVENSYKIEIKYNAEKQRYETYGYYSPYVLFEGIKKIAFSDEEFELDLSTILDLTSLIPDYVEFALPVMLPIITDTNTVVYGHMPLSYWMLVQENQ